MSTSRTRQESHRIYLQQLKSTNTAENNGGGGGVNEFELATRSAAVRLTSTATCEDVTHLLRKKFDLPSLISPASASSKSQNHRRDSAQHSPLVNRIHAHLKKVRSKSKLDDKVTEAPAVTHNYDSSSNDALVLVLSCFSMPKNFIRFEHESGHYRTTRAIDERGAAGGEGTHDALDCLSSMNEKSRDMHRNLAPSGDGLEGRLKEINSTGKETHEGSDDNFTTMKQRPPVRTNYSSNTNDPRTNDSLQNIEPFNIVRTVKPHENPLKIRDEMMHYSQKIQKEAEIDIDMERTSNHSASEISLETKPPIVRWFFMPCESPNIQTEKADNVRINCVRCVDMDGYCTNPDTESENSDSCINDYKVGNSSSKSNDGVPSVPEWIQLSQPYSKDRDASERIMCQSRLLKERHRLTVLSRSEAAVGNNCISGYLLKQSKDDEHVWKRVHCVLTDNQFWYISRMKKTEQGGHTSQLKTTYTPFSRIGIHKSIYLKRSTLSTSMAEDSPLFSTPYIFKLTAESGMVYTFRSSTYESYRHWIQHLSERAEICHDNASFDLADLIVSGETLAREKRCEDLLLKQLFSSISIASVARGFDDQMVQNLMRFAIAITEFKEICRRFHNVIKSCPHVTIMQKDNQKPAEILTKDISSDTYTQSTKYIKNLIYNAWKMAFSILHQSRHIASILTMKHNCEGKNGETNVDVIELLQEDVGRQIDEFQSNESMIPSSELFDEIFYSCIEGSQLPAE